MKMDRRDFLKGGVVAAAAVATASAVAGCAPQPKNELSVAGDAAAESAVGLEKTGYQCSEDWLGEAPVIDESDIVQVVETEVVVCGGGNSGVQCALAAAQEGSQVVVIEMQPKETYSAFGNDIAAYNSQLLTEQGFGGYDTGEIVGEFVRRGAGRVNADIIRSFVENSGEMLDNLVAITPDTSNVFDFDSGQCQVQTGYKMDNASYYPLERSGFKGWASCLQTCCTHNPNPVDGRPGEEVFRVTELQTYSRLEAERLGATWYWESAATVLVQNEAGDVTGVIAKTPEGYVQFNASKAVCLCTGDFSGNADMVWNLMDDVNELGARNGMDRSEMTNLGRDGSGHKMGCWAGGVIECHPRPSMNSMMYTPGPWGDAPFCMLNCKGERFMNEGMGGLHTPMMLRQPHGIISVVTDLNYMDTLKEVNVDHGAPAWGRAYEEFFGFWETMQEGVASAVAAGKEGADVHDIAVPYDEWIPGERFRIFKVYGAETLEELLQMMGYEGDALTQALATIEDYNRMCRNGLDEVYGKDSCFMKPIDTPPFYGAYIDHKGWNTTGLVTMAGLVTDKDMNVLRPDYTTPIKGLYASGNCLGHRYGPAYSTPTAGVSCGMALTHGRVLGKYVAAL